MRAMFADCHFMLFPSSTRLSMSKAGTSSFRICPLGFLHIGIERDVLRTSRYHELVTGFLRRNRPIYTKGQSQDQSHLPYKLLAVRIRVEGLTWRRSQGGTE